MLSIVTALVLVVRCWENSFCHLLIPIKMDTDRRVPFY